ncbi:Indole-3-glycerol phosphate synthase [Planctomycetales bacterium 10988]|nr:Indole-3-glycerol phosphate synthase [Planctomycetales bacterium 10988]
MDITGAGTILDEIVATKQTELTKTPEKASPAFWQEALSEAPPVRDFLAAVTSRDLESGERLEPVALIAEVKRASPSAGLIREDFDPVKIAKIYEEAGASAISVLTESHYFQGSLDYLKAIREEVQLPILRKDFILAPSQIWEARAAGADAVLLIAECLNNQDLRILYEETLAFGMTPLVELYDPENLTRVLDLGAKLIGINNRNLRTFETDLGHTKRLRKEIPMDRVVVGESGIRTFDDVQSLADAEVDAMLVGESLMRQADLHQAVQGLLGKKRG